MLLRSGLLESCKNLSPVEVVQYYVINLTHFLHLLILYFLERIQCFSIAQKVIHILDLQKVLLFPILEVYECVIAVELWVVPHDLKSWAFHCLLFEGLYRLLRNIHSKCLHHKAAVISYL